MSRTTGITTTKITTTKITTYGAAVQRGLSAAGPARKPVLAAVGAGEVAVRRGRTLAEQARRGSLRLAEAVQVRLTEARGRAGSLLEQAPDRARAFAQRAPERARTQYDELSRRGERLVGDLGTPPAADTAVVDPPATD